MAWNCTMQVVEPIQELQWNCVMGHERGNQQILFLWLYENWHNFHLSQSKVREIQLQVLFSIDHQGWENPPGIAHYHYSPSACPLILSLSQMPHPLVVNLAKQHETNS